MTYRIVGRLRPGPVNRSFRLGQLASGGLLALSHGTNDAQKTMGIMTLALIAHGSLKAKGFHVPTWVVVTAATAIALGTFSGGWRIIRTMGTRIIKMDAAQGLSAQGAGAAVILAASGAGYPLSTTHVISGGIMGAGAAKRLSAVRWGVAGNIVVAWVLTLPAAAAIGALAYGISRIFGTGALGPLLISVSLLALLAAIFSRAPGRQLAPATGSRRRAVAAGGGMMAAIVDAAKLLDVVLTALASGVGVIGAVLARGAGRDAGQRPAPGQPRRLAGLRGTGHPQPGRVRGRRGLRRGAPQPEVSGSPKRSAKANSSTSRRDSRVGHGSARCPTAR